MLTSLQPAGRAGGQIGLRVEGGRRECRKTQNRRPLEHHAAAPPSLSCSAHYHRYHHFLTDVLRKLQHAVHNGHIFQIHRPARHKTRGRVGRQPSWAVGWTVRGGCQDAALLAGGHAVDSQNRAHLSSGMEAGAASEEASCCSAARSCRDSSCMSACRRENCSKQ